MTDALSPFDLATLDALPEGYEAKVEALAAAYRRWGHLEKKAQWMFGRALRDLFNVTPKLQRSALLRRIGIARTTAYRWMELADGYADLSQLEQVPTADAALKALPPKRPKGDDAPSPRRRTSVADTTGRLTCPTCDGIDPETCMRCNGRGWLSADEVGPPPDEPEAVTGEVVSDAEGNAAMDEAAAEHEEQRDHDAEREEEEERHAMQAEHVDPADEQRKAAQRHRQDVHAVNEARRMAAKDRRKTADVCDAILDAKPCECGSGAVHVADLLARFFGVARK